MAGAETDNQDWHASLGWDINLRGYNASDAGILNAVNDGVDVINMSWIWPYYYNHTLIRDAIEDALTVGIVVVAGAGNDPPQITSLSYCSGPPCAVAPAAYAYPNLNAQVIAVAATDINDEYYDNCSPANLCPYNWSPGTNPITDQEGAFIDVAAPGIAVRVLHVNPDGTPNSVTRTGTSMAAPLTAALAGLMISVDPTITPPEVFDNLISTTFKANAAEYPYNVIGEGGNTWNQRLGYGRIDAAAALASVLGPGTCPTGYSCLDIGSPAHSGFTNTVGNTVSVSGGGDIWSNDDDFHFVHFAVDGDIDYKVRVTSLTGGDPNYAKAGVMIRESLTRTARNAYALILPDDGSPAGWFQRRTSTGGTTYKSGIYGTHAPPEWVRIVRQGNNFSAYASDIDGSWVQIGPTVSIPMSSSAFVGVAVTSSVNKPVATATITDLPPAGSNPPPSGGCPVGYTCDDVGFPNQTGSTSTTPGGLVNVTGAGDIWSSGDDFHYAYYSVTGDIDYRARVVSLTGGSTSYAKAGVMIRESLNTGSKNAYALVLPDDGSPAGWFQRRTTTNGTTDKTGVYGTHAPPEWVRIVRQGNNFSAYASNTNGSWTQIGSTVSISMSNTVLVGLAVTGTGGNPAATATFESVPAGGSSKALHAFLGEEIPEEPELRQNYPNPFNPTTRFEFSLPKRAAIKIIVYDAIGRKVETLADRQFARGIHSVVFDASHLPSGLYFAVMEAGDQRLVQKMMLAK